MNELKRFILSELRPKGPLVTPFNVITTIFMLITAVLLIVRFAGGLSTITNLSQEYPWGLWIGFDVVTGVAFAAGAYMLTFLVYILKMEKFHPIVRVTILNGLLAYIFYAGALLLDLGRPWNVINPIIGNSFGVSSVMFLVAWHFMLYMFAEFIEFSPAAAEWLGLKRIHKFLTGLTLGAVIFGITLSLLHQSGLGALFLMARNKIHPLWYTEFIPILFLVSSIFAGLSMVIFEGSITHKVFHHKLSEKIKTSNNDIVINLAKIAAGVMAVYLFMKILVFVHSQNLPYLFTGWGEWYAVEVIGFVTIPAILYYTGAMEENIPKIKIAAVLTMIGIILNRLNISIIAFKWYSPIHYYPSWMEIMVTLGVISAELWAFRWVINRMPVLNAGGENI